jgi:sugar-specific transcriptional regulator TrmB/CheY-like chemotaxis protein
VTDDQRLGILEGFGLSGYQARAYLALLELGPTQAREVSERSGVPQGRVYDILEKLAQRGLVEVLPEAPRRFRAVPFEVFLERELRLHAERIDVLQRDREQLIQSMSPAQREAPATARGEYVVVRGRKGVLDRVAEVLGGAQRDVLLVGTDATLRRLRDEREVLERLAARGVRVRLLVAVEPASAEDVRACLALGVEVQHFGGLRGAFPAGLHVLLADGQRAVLYQHAADDAAARADDVALLMEHPQIVQGVRALAEAIWTLASPAAERLHQLAAEQPGAWAGQTILLVDDEPDIRQSLQELLESGLHGIRVASAESGEAALAWLQQQPVDLIITDYKMPGMNGLQLLEEAQKVAPGVSRIMITAFPDVRVATRAINEARVDHFFVKPLPDARVVDVVRDVLADRRSRQLRDEALARLLERAPAQGAGGVPPAV